MAAVSALAVRRDRGRVDRARAAGGPVVEVGVDRGEPLEGRVVQGGDERVVEPRAERGLQRLVDRAEAQQVVGVRLLVELAAHQLGHERRVLGGLVLGHRAFAHRGREGGVDEGVVEHGHGGLLGGVRAGWSRCGS